MSSQTRVARIDTLVEDEVQAEAVYLQQWRVEGRAIALPRDVIDRQAVERAVAMTEAQLGPITLLVNNAGILTSGLIGTIDLDEVVAQCGNQPAWPVPLFLRFLMPRSCPHFITCAIISDRAYRTLSIVVRKPFRFSADLPSAASAHAGRGRKFEVIDLDNSAHDKGLRERRGICMGRGKGKEKGRVSSPDDDKPDPYGGEGDDSFSE